MAPLSPVANPAKVCALVSSSMVISETATLGSSFTELTTIVLVTSPALNAVAPPFVDVSPVSPTTPAVLSQALYLMVAVPKKSVLGTKRILWLGLVPSRSLEKLADTAPKSVKLVPSVENCHWPSLLSTNVTATPGAASSANGLVSLILMAAAALSRVDTASPLLLVLSSSMAVKLSLAVKLLPLGLEKKPPEVVKIGASLTAAILMVKVFEPVLSSPTLAVPPSSTTSTLTVAVPCALSVSYTHLTLPTKA